jgi:type I restriction enzyme R subunit
VISNFEFLKADWPELFGEARCAEQLSRVDPRAACFYARRTLELAVKWLYDAERSLRTPYKSDLNARLHEPTFKNLVGAALLAKMNIIRKLGNDAVHGNRAVPERDSVASVRELFHVAFWLGWTYSRTETSRPSGTLRFDDALLPRRQPSTPPAQSRAELQRLAERLASQDTQLAAERERSSTLQEQIEALQAEVAAAKAANQTRPDIHDYDEQHTRDHYIDLLLHDAGWPLDGENDREFEVTGMPNPSGTGYVDYVLWGDDGLPLAVVEAKRAQRSPQAGQQQAKLYADRLEATYGQRPLIYYTNGFEHWFWDDFRYPPRRVEGFHTKDELQLAVQRRTTLRPLSETVIKSEIGERHYQQRAIRRIAETFERDNQRKALLVMATGAGKTRTVIALVDLLQRCNWVKRVLFLADRIALVNQAVNAFKQHLPSSSPVNLVTERAGVGRVYVSTYPTMMNLIDSTRSSGGRRFGVGHFDLIVIDEAHRSVYQKYRTIFSYFDALLVGLTATPRDEVDRDTYSLFDLEPGVPTDSYSLDEAVSDGYLVPYRAISVPLRFPQQGIRYADLTDEEKARWDSLEWDDDGTIPTEVDPDAVNKWLFNIDTLDKMLATVMTHGLAVAGGDRIGKTIIFAKNKDHADAIVERFNANYPEHRGSFARAITHETVYAQNLIDDFATKERPPHIAVSVDMLDTGIDVPEVVNLVFFKRVRSKTKFWQMIGRGTRLCPDLIGPGADKTEFFIFDVCRNFEFFSQNPQTADGNLVESLSQRLFKHRLSLLASLDARDLPADPVGDAERALRGNTADLLHRIVAGMNQDNFVVRPHRQLVQRYRDRSAWDHLDSQAIVEIADWLSSLPSAERDDDEQAKRFDLLILRAQLCMLNHEPGFANIAERGREIANALLEQTTIPAIREQEVFLEALAEQQWWDDVTVPMLEEARHRIRSLVRLIERIKRKTLYTDFTDELGELIELPPVVSSGHGDTA